MGDRRLRRRESRDSRLRQGDYIPIYLLCTCALHVLYEDNMQIFHYIHMYTSAAQNQLYPYVVVCSHPPSIPTIHPLYSRLSHCVVVNKLRGFVRWSIHTECLVWLGRVQHRLRIKARSGSCRCNCRDCDCTRHNARADYCALGFRRGLTGKHRAAAIGAMMELCMNACNGSWGVFGCRSRDFVAEED